MDQDQQVFEEMVKRTKSDADKTREGLLESAAHYFSQQGYADTSIAEICERAGTTKGALFHHFENKEALFLAVWTKLQTDMDEEARKAAFSARSLKDPYAAFLAGCRTYLKWASRADYQQIVLTDGPAVLGIAGWYESDHHLGNRNVESGIRYLAKKGIVAPENVKALAIMVQSALNGCGFALARNSDGVDRASIFKAGEALIRGLR